MGLAIRKIPGGAWLAKKMVSGLGGIGKKLAARLVAPAAAAGKGAGSAAGIGFGSSFIAGASVLLGAGMGAVVAEALRALNTTIDQWAINKFGKTGKGYSAIKKFLGGNASKIPGLGGAAPIIERALGGKALGGVIPRGGASWVGERGPEMAIAGQSGTRIMPAGGSRIPQLQGALAATGAGGGGGEVIHSHVYLDGRQIAEAVDRRNKAREARR